MMSILIIMLMFMITSILFLTFNFFISLKSTKNREKMSPFECGFDPISKSRMPFSIHFFLISLIFLIFDVEITLLIPMIFMLFTLNKIMISSFSFFIIILIFSLMMEYWEQSIEWKN